MCKKYDNRFLLYQFRNSTGTHEWYQTGREDFLKMFRNKNWRENVTWCKVKLFWKKSSGYDTWFWNDYGWKLIEQVSL